MLNDAISQELTETQNGQNVYFTTIGPKMRP